ncbi:arginine decarboxylase, pyruvoyl-dependent [archaeon]|nr:arginine decarboxylase, pyruvoyl-dependent [archaeon]
MYVPSEIFFTTGIGMDKNKLTSFEMALRDAGIESNNIVNVSSILPPYCKIVSREYGTKKLQPGQIVHCVLAKEQTDEPSRLLVASIGVAVPKDRDKYGYLSEHHGFGQTKKHAGDYAEDLAATMLATTLGINFDPETAWKEREKTYKAGGQIFNTKNYTKSAVGNKKGMWTTVIAAAVLLPSYEAGDLVRWLDDITKTYKKEVEQYINAMKGTDISPFKL